jgi:hypothetical protein
MILQVFILEQLYVSLFLSGIPIIDVLAGLFGNMYKMLLQVHR